MTCSHPKTARMGFFPSTTAGHERCLDCGALRYQVSKRGPWWPWELYTIVLDAEDDLDERKALLDEIREISRELADAERWMNEGRDRGWWP